MLVDAIPDFFRSVLVERGLLIRELCLRTGKRSRNEMAFQLHLFVPPFFCLKSSNRSPHVFRDIPESQRTVIDFPSRMNLQTACDFGSKRRTPPETLLPLICLSFSGACYGQKNDGTVRRQLSLRISDN